MPVGHDDVAFDEARQIRAFTFFFSMTRAKCETQATSNAFLCNNLAAALFIESLQHWSSSFFWGASCLITLQDMAQRKIQGHWLCADRLGTYGEHITWDGVLRLGTTPWHGKSHLAMNYTRCYKQLAFPPRSDLAVAEPTSAPSQSRLCSLAVKMIRHGMIY